MKTRRACLQFELQGISPSFVGAYILAGDMMLGADNLKALDDGKVVTEFRRRSRQVFLPVAGPRFDHHKFLDPQSKATASKPNL
jgi:hypothetical protein